MAETTIAPPPTAPAPPTLAPQPAKLGVSAWMESIKNTETDESPEQPQAPEPKAAPAQERPQAPAEAPKEPAAEPEDKWPRTAQEWKKFKEARKEKETSLSKEVESYKAKMADYEARLSGAPSPEQTKEAEQLKKENEELSKRLQVVDVTKHPKFEAYFQGKTGAQVELAKRIVGGELSERIEALLTQPNSDTKQQLLEDFFLELTPAQQSRLGGVINNLDSIESERQSEIANASENYQAMVAKQNEARTQVAKNFESLFDRVSKEAGDPKEGIAPFQKRTGDEAWNAKVDERIAHAKKLMTGKGVTQEEVVRASLYAAAIPTILQHNLDLQTEVDKLKAQVQSLSNATPRVEGGAKTAGEASHQTAPKSGARPMDVMKDWMKNFRDTMNQE